MSVVYEKDGSELKTTETMSVVKKTSMPQLEVQKKIAEASLANAQARVDEINLKIAEAKKLGL